VKRKIVIIAILISIFSCKNSDKNIEKFKKEYPKIHIENYNVIWKWESDRFIHYEMADTVEGYSKEFVAFFVLKEDIKKGKKGDVVLSEYIKTEMKDGVIISETQYDKNIDTLYSFYSENDSIKFKRGRFYYYFSKEKKKLTEKQIDYFLEYQDSIVRNGINEIPLFD